MKENIKIFASALILAGTLTLGETILKNAISKESITLDPKEDYDYQDESSDHYDLLKMRQLASAISITDFENAVLNLAITEDLAIPLEKIDPEENNYKYPLEYVAYEVDDSYIFPSMMLVVEKTDDYIIVNSDTYFNHADGTKELCSLEGCVAVKKAYKDLLYDYNILEKGGRLSELDPLVIEKIATIKESIERLYYESHEKTNNRS